MDYWLWIRHGWILRCLRAVEGEGWSFYHFYHYHKIYCGIDVNDPENWGGCVICGWCLMFKTSHIQQRLEGFLLAPVSTFTWYFCSSQCLKSCQHRGQMLARIHNPVGTSTVPRRSHGNHSCQHCLSRVIKFSCAFLTSAELWLCSLSNEYLCS